MKNQGSMASQKENGHSPATELKGTKYYNLNDR